MAHKYGKSPIVLEGIMETRTGVCKTLYPQLADSNTA